MPDGRNALHILAYKRSLARRERSTKRVVVPRKESIGGLLDIEPDQPRRLMRGGFDPTDHPTEIDPGRMRTKSATNPVTNVAHRFDIESRLFANLANHGLLRRFPRFERPAWR